MGFLTPNQEKKRNDKWVKGIIAKDKAKLTAKQTVKAQKKYKVASIDKNSKFWKGKEKQDKGKAPSIDNTYDDVTSGSIPYDGGSGGYGGSGGGYVKPTLDISGLLKAYQSQADADKSAAKQVYDTTRNDLLTSLKRFQEQNAKDVQNQQRSFLSNQASLESARAQADRQNRIASSARGLGGSGLQQLAQLQNLMAQGQDVSDLATDNNQKMETLRQALQQMQSDTDTKLNSALTTYNNALKSIEANLAKSKAEAEMQKAQYEASGGSSGGYSGGGYSGGGYGSDSAYAADLNSLASSLAGTVDAFQNSKKDKTARSAARSQIYSILADYGASASSGAGLKALNNIDTIYKGKTSAKKSSKKKKKK